MFGGNSSGIEMMLKSMGLGSVIDAAKELAESGAVQRIVAFSDGLEELNASVKRIEARLGIEAPEPAQLAALAAPGGGGGGRSAETAPLASVGGGS